MKLVALFASAFLALSLTACSDKSDDGAKQAAETAAPHAQAPAGEVKSAPATGSYDPTKDEDGDC
jgi:hypothetical protein